MTQGPEGPSSQKNGMKGPKTSIFRSLTGPCRRTKGPHLVSSYKPIEPREGEPSLRNEPSSGPTAPNSPY